MGDRGTQSYAHTGETTEWEVGSSLSHLPDALRPAQIQSDRIQSH